MQSAIFLTILLVASVASAAPSHPESQASNTAPVQSSAQSQSSPGHSSSPVVGVVGASPVENSQASSIEQPQHHSPPTSYYSPAGLINVVGVNEQQQGGSSVSGGSSGVSVGGNKPPVATVRSFEQYGQPESASLPANYKPFGSWGLYIGGNPADGYYTNYYKALGNSADKQQAGASAANDQQLLKPVVGQAAFAPVLKQVVQGSSPQVGSNDYYSFAYSPSDLNSGVMQAVSPIQGTQVYNSPPSASYDPSSYAGVSSYADAYATKKVGALYASQKEQQHPQQAPQSSKSYQQSRVYVYPTGPLASPHVGQLSAPVQSVQSVSSHQHQPQQQQGQVVSYPIPVGSQIVGSQPGVEGAFSPYGVHGFTRYAFKPTIVSQDPSYYYGAQSAAGGQQQHVQSYKPQQQHQHQHEHQHQPQYAAYPAGVQQAAPSQEGSYYPMSFYGYPMNQLHYSQGSIVPSVHSGEPNYGPMASPQVDSVAEKSDNEDKSVHKQQ